MYTYLVSVIVPVYNVQRHIAKCLDSILEQTYKNIEVIIIDDGSTDKTPDIISEKYAAKSCIRHFKKQNGGVSSARNLGMDLANGDLITFVDADDWLEQRFIEEGVHYLEQTGADLVIGWTIKTDREKRRYIANNSESMYIYEQDLLKDFKGSVLGSIKSNLPELANCLTSGSCCKLIRTSVLNDIFFRVDLPIGEDTVFNLEVLDQSRKIAVIPKVWYYYRQNNTSATRRVREQISDETERLLKVLQKWHEKDDFFSPFFIERALQQFQGIMILYPLHKQSRLSFRNRIRYIKSVLNSPFWEDFFWGMALRYTPSKLFSKVMVFFCIRKMPFSIFILFRCKSILGVLRRLGEKMTSRQN